MNSSVNREDSADTGEMARRARSHGDFERNAGGLERFRKVNSAVCPPHVQHKRINAVFQRRTASFAFRSDEQVLIHGFQIRQGLVIIRIDKLRAGVDAIGVENAF